MNLREDLLLYLVTDPVICGSRGIIPVCREALDAGVRFLQLRDKSASTRELIDTAVRLARLAESFGSVFVVNDRVDVAMASGAMGVHLGDDDMPPALARRILGPRALIGVSVRTREGAERAWLDGADYLAANIVFSTPTKPDRREPLGIPGVTALAECTPLPLVAIGGINRENAAGVMAAGASGVAVVSAIMGAADPGEAARELLAILRSR
jgi:thiamine-phosphate pyrophosphorylase